MKFLELTDKEAVGTPVYKVKEGPTTPRWKPRLEQPMYLSHLKITNYTRATKYEEEGNSNKAKYVTERICFGEGDKPLTFDYYLNKALDTSHNE